MLISHRPPSGYLLVASIAAGYHYFSSTQLVTCKWSLATQRKAPHASRHMGPIRSLRIHNFNLLPLLTQPACLPPASEPQRLRQSPPSPASASRPPSSAA